MVVLYFLLVLGVCLYYVPAGYFLEKHKENLPGLAKTLALNLFCTVLFVSSQRGRFGVKCFCSSGFSSSSSKRNEDTSEVGCSQFLLQSYVSLKKSTKKGLPCQRKPLYFGLYHG